jgi:hypothetical protein
LPGAESIPMLACWCSILPAMAEDLSAPGCAGERTECLTLMQRGEADVYSTVAAAGGGGGLLPGSSGCVLPHHFVCELSPVVLRLPYDSSFGCCVSESVVPIHVVVSSAPSQEEASNRHHISSHRRRGRQRTARRGLAHRSRR